MPRPLLKAAAVLNALLLLSGYVWYRASMPRQEAHSNRVANGNSKSRTRSKAAQTEFPTRFSRPALETGIQSGVEAMVIPPEILDAAERGAHFDATWLLPGSKADAHLFHQEIVAPPETPIAGGTFSAQTPRTKRRAAGPANEAGQDGSIEPLTVGAETVAFDFRFPKTAPAPAPRPIPRLVLLSGSKSDGVYVPLPGMGLSLEDEEGSGADDSHAADDAWRETVRPAARALYQPPRAVVMSGSKSGDDIFDNFADFEEWWRWVRGKPRD